MYRSLYNIRGLFLGLLVLLTACGQATNGFGEVVNKPQEQPGTISQPAVPSGGTLQPVLATSELVVGPNRVAIGLLENNVPIPDAAQTKVKVRYYRVTNDEAMLTGEEQVTYYGEGLGPRGTYIAHPSFDAAGTWGLEVIAQRPGKSAVTQRIGVMVTDKGSAVAVGTPAPKTKTPTAADVSDLKTITSATNPNPQFYQLSVDQAVTSGKPSMILFATPGFCQTAVCGPGVDVLQRLADKFGDQVNAVHVEIYQHPFEKLQTVPAMSEWGLRTEPWLFLVGKDGRIVDRFEGGITSQEIAPAVEKLVQGT
jgi:hypothetical protein